ncbi:A.superbus venom factor 1-like [Micropterus salmoides]|uniref:A.superbus venom factor 1-like n=1 Tax=Micropterus salmoides TaxID=27706 RepID=UPI0018ECCBD0|nr:A.superbus venom factor 1-like [Micropterus salmoides]
MHGAADPVVSISSAPRFTLLAPDLLRTDSQENIYLQADGLSNPITVSISIQDFSKTATLLQDSVTLNVENGYYILKSIQVTHQGHNLRCLGLVQRDMRVFWQKLNLS